jgi:hypothetical protein
MAYANAKAVPGFENYFATEAGEIISTHRNKVSQLKGGIDKDGYRKVILCKDGERHYKRVHVVVANTFLGNQPKGTVVCHVDGDLKNNKPENLKYATQKENIRDKEKHGTKLFGEKIPSSRLAEREVIEIFESSEPSRKLAAKYSVSKGAIDAIRNSKTWAWLTKGNHSDDELFKNNPF